MKRFFTAMRKNVPIPCVILWVIGLVAAAVNISYVNSTAFADFFNGNVGAFFRGLLAKISSIYPCSLAELLLLCSPVILVAVVLLCVKKAEQNFPRVVVSLLTVPVAVYSLFVFTFGSGYHASSLDKKLELEREKLSPHELAVAMEYVIDRVAELEGEIIYTEKAGSVRPYSHKECVDKLIEAYDSLSEKNDFISNIDVPVKELLISDIMTYTHISGVYTFFTGESNLNENYPNFINVFTTAHEMAHQRGIAREDEANFVAYLVCMESEDPYIHYSAELNMYQYLSNALYSADRELWRETAVKLSPGARYELNCYSEFFDKYRESVAAEVSDKVNDTYLKFQGTEGTKSYGMVVDLAVAYIKSEHNELF